MAGICWQSQSLSPSTDLTAKVMPRRYTKKVLNGFEIHTLANDRIALSMVPELGGRLVSLKDRATGREWLDGWSPAAKRRLWHPTDPQDYETGPGAGIDECLPTVLACKVKRKALGDHGELWNRAPAFDQELASKGVLVCSWNLTSLPLNFERRVSIAKNQVRFDYRIENRADVATPFLWAWHPLFSWKPGDKICPAKSIQTCLTPGGEVMPWPLDSMGNDLSKARFVKGATPAAKIFLGPLGKGRVAIRAKNGSSLELSWPASLFPYAGVWITRGFWKGLHHWAIEPTNAAVDCLSDVAVTDAPAPCLLAAREVRHWSLSIRMATNEQ